MTAFPNGIRFMNSNRDLKRRCCPYSGLFLLGATDEQADEINRAVNAHDALVRALRVTLGRIEGAAEYDRRDPSDDYAVQEARAALALARGQ